MFQFFNLLEGMTVLENVTLPSIIAGSSRKVAEARAKDLLDLLGISEKTSQLPGVLSGGQRQRLSVARALANEPTLLLADEPTGSLDSAGGAEILELLRRLHVSGQTIVLVTHADAVAAAADRIVRMRDGRIDDGVDDVVAGSGDPVFADLVAERGLAMRAVWTRASSDLRHHLRAAIVVAVLIGLTSALALAAAEAAQRTDTAYARLRAAVNAPDELVASGTGTVAALIPHVDFSKVAALPQVKATREVAWMIGEGVGADGKALFGGVAQGTSILGASTAEGQSAIPWKVLEGRLPDPTRSDEVVVGYYPALNDPQAAVGSTIDLRLLKASVTPQELAGAGSASPAALDAALGPPIPVKVVGRVLVLDNSQLSGNNHEFFVSPAFVRKYQPSTLQIDYLLVTLKNGAADSAAFEKELLALYPTASVASSGDEVTVVRRAVDVRVTALWLVALLTTVVGFMIFGQALSRLNFAESTENPILSALGMTRRQLFAVAMLRAAAIGTAAGIVAFVVAVAASGFFPTGLARIVEPTPGTNVAAIVVAGAVLVALGVLLLSVVPALRARTRAR